MARAFQGLVIVALLGGAPGCWSHLDALPFMDIPPYRDPPPGFSSSYHRALYGPRPRRIAEPTLDEANLKPTDQAGSDVSSTDENGVRVLRHETPRARAAEDSDVAEERTDENRSGAGRRPPAQSRFDFLFRRPRPIRF